MRFCPMSLLRRLAGPFLLALILVGCSLPSPPSYTKIDQTTPAFQAALALEKQRLIAEGKTEKQAQQAALGMVTKRLRDEATDVRVRQVAPVVNALLATEQKHGCWSYVVTTTERIEGKTDNVLVERFDASQPEDRLWTLLSHDGTAPDEKALADYRKTRLRAWKRSQSSAGRPESTEAADDGKYGELDIATDPATHLTTYTLNQAAWMALPIGDFPDIRRTHVLDEAGRLVQSTEKYLGPASALGGSLKLDHFEGVTDYATVDPALAPFVVRNWQRFRGILFGVNSGLREREIVYSEYRRVTCYDDRFEVVVGPLKVGDVAPSK
jgi:hypothetical protein